MKTHYRSLAVATTLAVAALGVGAFFIAGDARASEPSLTSRPDLVKRGEYLVHGLGLCIDCHSPRNEVGEFLAGKHLTGSPIPFAPTVPMPAWGPVAPMLSGLPAGWSEQDMVRFLMTGERPHGMPAVRPPMPPYRMEQADAEAVTAYIRLLPSLAEQP